MARMNSHRRWMFSCTHSVRRMGISASTRKLVMPRATPKITSNPKFFLDKGQVYALQGDRDGMSAVLDTVLSLDPRKPEILFESLIGARGARLFMEVTIGLLTH